MGLVRPTEMFRVWILEAAVGLVNGVALGFLVSVVAFAYGGNFYLGVVVGIALCLNTLVAVSIGGTVPLLTEAFRIRPRRS